MRINKTYSTPLELMQPAVRLLFHWVVGCEPGTPRGPECFSVQYQSLLFSARCLSFSTSGFQHNQYWQTQQKRHVKKEYPWQFHHPTYQTKLLKWFLINPSHFLHLYYFHKWLITYPIQLHINSWHRNKSSSCTY